MTESKVKMDVELRILKASVIVQEPSEVYVQWHRGKNSAPTKKRSVDQQTSVIEYGRKEALWTMSTRFTQNADQTYQEDNNKLILYCANQIVGTCFFNLSSYIDKKPVAEKAMIVPVGSTDTGVVLKGNPEQYPGSFIEFRATVTSPAAVAKKAPAAAAQSARTPSLNIVKEAQSHEELPTPREEKNIAMALQLKTMQAQIQELSEENKSLKESAVATEQSQNQGISETEAAEKEATALHIKELESRIEEFKNENKRLKKNGEQREAADDSASALAESHEKEEISHKVKELEECIQGLKEENEQLKHEKGSAATDRNEAREP